MNNLYAQVLEQKRQKELQERNLNAKRRLQEIASGTQTQWSGNIKDLKNSPYNFHPFDNASVTR